MSLIHLAARSAPLLLCAILLSFYADAANWIYGPPQKNELLVFEFKDLQVDELAEATPQSLGGKSFRLIQSKGSSAALQWNRKGNIIFISAKDPNSKVRITLEIAKNQKVRISSVSLKVTQKRPLTSQWRVVAQSIDWKCEGAQVLSLKSKIEPSLRRSQSTVELYSPKITVDLKGCTQSISVRTALLNGKIEDQRGDIEIASVRSSLELKDNAARFDLRAAEIIVKSHGLLNGHWDAKKGELNVEDHKGSFSLITVDAKIKFGQSQNFSRFQIEGDAPSVSLLNLADSRVSLSSQAGTIQCAADLKSTWTESLKTCEGNRGDGSSRIIAKLKSGRIRFK